MAAPAEDTEVEEMRRELKGFSASLAASKGTKAKLEAKVSQWETKLAKVRAMGDEERIRMAEDTLRKAKAKLTEKEEAIEALDRSVRRMELVLAGTVEKEKEEEVDEVVEVDVEPEQMEEGTVKDEVEAKVVETPAGGGGEPMAQGVDAVEGCVGFLGPAMGPHCPGWPPPRPNLDTPLLVALESPVWTLRFCCSGCTTGCWGRGGGYGWTKGGWPTWTSPCAYVQFWAWSVGVSNPPCDGTLFRSRSL